MQYNTTRDTSLKRWSEGVSEEKSSLSSLEIQGQLGKLTITEDQVGYLKDSLGALQQQIKDEGEGFSHSDFINEVNSIFGDLLAIKYTEDSLQPNLNYMGVVQEITQSVETKKKDLNGFVPNQNHKDFSLRRTHYIL